MTIRSWRQMFASFGKLSLISGALIGQGFAADYYVLPESAGTGDGSSWDNAAKGSREAVASQLEMMQGGDHLYFGSGEYPSMALTFTASGEEGNPIKVQGVDTGSGLPVAIGSFKKENPSKGPSFLKINEGASYWTLDGFQIKNYKGVVYGRGKNIGLTFTNLEVTDCRIGIYLKGGGDVVNPDTNSHDIRIADSSFIGFTKSAVRFEDGNYNATVENVFADAGGEPYGKDPFHMAFFIPGHKKGKAYSPADDHHITFINCEARNSHYDRGKKYWNGDGFATERGTHDISFINCRAFNSTDGGWDIKSDNAYLENCIAMGNKRNIRIWGSAKLVNCVMAYSKHPGGTGGPSGLFLTGTAKVVVENSTIVNNHGPQVHIEKPKDGCELIIRDSLIGWTGEEPKTLIRAGKAANVELVETILFETGPQGPEFVGLVEDWDGSGDAFNNLDHGSEKGFNQE
tara:strand:+ start:18341 stop:19714 length:1374 start_codon:yes stop_codon:yes gene_type:complete